MANSVSCHVCYYRESKAVGEGGVEHVCRVQACKAFRIDTDNLTVYLWSICNLQIPFKRKTSLPSISAKHCTALDLVYQKHFSLQKNEI